MDYPNLFDWYKDGYMIENNFIVAPEDFCLSRDGEKEDYRFTWKEVRDIEEEILLPYGWEIPTMNDWEVICKYFSTYEEMAYKLHLVSRGYTYYDDAERREKVSNLGKSRCWYYSKDNSRKWTRGQVHYASLDRHDSYKYNEIANFSCKPEQRKFAIRCISRDQRYIKHLHKNHK